jgi:hypothetical protein
MRVAVLLRQLLWLFPCFAVGEVVAGFVLVYRLRRVGDGLGHGTVLWPVAPTAALIQPCDAWPVWWQ